MDKKNWKSWLALAGALFGISLFTAVTAGESKETLKEKAEKADEDKKSDPENK